MDTSLLIIITSALTGFAASAFNAMYMRKNLITTKYIDTITNERIKRIQIVRDDLTELVSAILVYLKNTDYYHELISEKEMNDYANYVSGRDVDSFTNEEIQYYSDVKKNIGNVENAMKKALNRSEIINKAIFLKLYLDPNEDIDIINQLNFIIEDFADYSILASEWLTEDLWP